MPPRRRVGRRLTKNQEQVLVNGGLFIRQPGESVDQLVLRLFGGWPAVRAARELHREWISARDPQPGQRCWAWWQWSAPPWEPDEEPLAPDLKIRRPSSVARRIPYDQRGVLARFGLLTGLEQLQLSQYERDNDGPNHEGERHEQ